jgi:hypothetical protein
MPDLRTKLLEALLDKVEKDPTSAPQIIQDLVDLLTDETVQEIMEISKKTEE